MSTEINVALIKLKQAHDYLIEGYQQEALGQDKLASETLLLANQLILEASTLVLQSAQHVIEKDKSPQLRLV